MTVEARDEREDVVIEACADALLAASALQTGDDPDEALIRALRALEIIHRRAEREAS